MNYGSFQSGTKQGLYRNEQPPPTQQGAFPKGKGAVVANAVTPRRLGLHLERLMYMLTTIRFFCIVLLKGGNVYVT